MKISDINSTPKPQDSIYEWIKNELNDIPEYVIYDLIYKNYSNSPNIIEDITFFKKMLSGKWTLENINITIDAFEPNTQKTLKRRLMGESPPTIPNDAKRHFTQYKLLIEQGQPSKEPIIIIKHNNGYELIEGWHRTIQSIELWPNGYTQNAWVLNREIQ